MTQNKKILRFTLTLQTCLPCDTGKFKEAQKIKQVAEPSNTPLSFDFSKAKRNDEECQGKTQPIKIVVRILEIRFPLPEKKEKKLLKYCSVFASSVRRMTETYSTVHELFTCFVDVTHVHSLLLERNRPQGLISFQDVCEGVHFNSSISEVPCT